MQLDILDRWTFWPHCSGSNMLPVRRSNSSVGPGDQVTRSKVLLKDRPDSLDFEDSDPWRS